MAKGKRLTVRLDDALDGKLNQMCESSDCTKSEYVEAILKDALEGGDDDIVLKKADNNSASRPAPSELRNPRLIIDDTKPTPVGTVDIKDEQGTLIERIEKDGTRHQFKNGKVVACKKPGKNWTVFIEA